MRGLWRRLGKLVAGSRRSEERLPVAVDALLAYQDHVDCHAPLCDCGADDVLRLLYGDSFRTLAGKTGRSGPRSLEGAWPVGDTFTRPLPRDRYTSGDCATRYGDLND